ncbi:thioredoxin family protein [Arcobacteraceae bacterium]|nr:thioredoxin family protein [Arcobacteraceae bacterium]
MKIFLIGLLLCSSLFAKSYKQFAQEMSYETDYKVALQKAKEQKKDILFVMVANFCPWCQKFEKKVLNKKIVNAKIQEKYIPLILNREEKNFPKQFETPIIPTMYFIDYKNENITNKVVGYNKREKFLNIINK